MNRRLQHLLERREFLLAQVAAQRIAVSQNIEPWRIPMAMTDQGLSALRLASIHPVWMVGGMAMLSALGHGRISKWLLRGLVTWRVIHELRSRQHTSQ